MGQDLRGGAEEAAERVKQTAQEGAQRLTEETRHRMEDEERGAGLRRGQSAERQTR